MIKLGITGGIGSGKSLLSKYLRCRNIPVYDTDAHAKLLMIDNLGLREALKELLGESAYISNQLNKEYIASCIFSDRSLLKKVNAIVHPVVKQDFIHWANKQNKSIVAMECAILFEADFSSSVDYIIQVSAPEELRISRAVKRDARLYKDIQSRVKNQMSDSERKKLADFEIINNDSIAVIPQIESILNKLSQ